MKNTNEQTLIIWGELCNEDRNELCQSFVGPPSKRYDVAAGDTLLEEYFTSNEAAAAWLDKARTSPEVWRALTGLPEEYRHTARIIESNDFPDYVTDLTDAWGLAVKLADQSILTSLARHEGTILATATYSDDRNIGIRLDYPDLSGPAEALAILWLVANDVQIAPEQGLTIVTRPPCPTDWKIRASA
jgi:hypothetical protein